MRRWGFHLRLKQCKSYSNQLTSNVTGRHQGLKCKVRAGVACAAHFCKLFNFPVHLRVTGYNFPFHMHILCIWYGTVLANTTVLSMHVCTVFAGMWRPPVSVITELYYVAMSICHCWVWYRMLSMRYACIQRSGIIPIPRLPLCQISFLSLPPFIYLFYLFIYYINRTWSTAK